MQVKYFPPRFSVQTYLICLSFIMLVAFIAFIILWRTERKVRKKRQAEQVIAEENTKSALLTVNNDEVEGRKEEEKFTVEKIVYLSIVLWTSILLIGCIPSINSYSLNPYGPSTFHYVIILCKSYLLFRFFFSKKFHFRSMLLSIGFVNF